jgi:IS30 family transposase
MLEAFWQGAGGCEKTRNKTRLGKMLGESRRTIPRGTYLHTESDLSERERHSADLAQLKAEEGQREHGPGLKIGSDHRLCRAIRDEVSRERHGPYAIVAKYTREGWPTETRIAGKTIYRYIQAGYIDGITAEDLLYRGKRRKAGAAPARHSRAGCAMRGIRMHSIRASARRS